MERATFGGISLLDTTWLADKTNASLQKPPPSHLCLILVQPFVLERGGVEAALADQSGPF
jgi:hypothetical protein